mmetsp:Transcript_66650/g.214740  ORF Transcript_66650/g.214740 Transcript_66650/m.214740 type:complete len:506 (+) Transcript_66650:470-1987(+)
MPSSSGSSTVPTAVQGSRDTLPHGAARETRRCFCVRRRASTSAKPRAAGNGPRPPPGSPACLSPSGPSWAARGLPAPPCFALAPPELRALRSSAGGEGPPCLAQSEAKRLAPASTPAAPSTCHTSVTRSASTLAALPDFAAVAAMRRSAARRSQGASSDKVLAKRIASASWGSRTSSTSNQRSIRSVSLPAPTSSATSEVAGSWGTLSRQASHMFRRPGALSAAGSVARLLHPSARSTSSRAKRSTKLSEQCAQSRCMARTSAPSGQGSSANVVTKIRPSKRDSSGANAARRRALAPASSSSASASSAATLGAAASAALRFRGFARTRPASRLSMSPLPRGGSVGCTSVRPNPSERAPAPRCSSSASCGRQKRSRRSHSASCAAIRSNGREGRFWCETSWRSSTNHCGHSSSCASLVMLPAVHPRCATSMMPLTRRTMAMPYISRSSWSLRGAFVAGLSPGSLSMISTKEPVRSTATGSRLRVRQVCTRRTPRPRCPASGDASCS